MTDQKKTIELFDSMRSALMDRGVSYWDANDILLTLDAVIYQQIAQDLTDKLDKNKNLELLTLLKSKLENNKIAQFLGVTKEELDHIHQEKLQICLDLLPQTLQKLSDQDIHNLLSD